MNAVGFPGLGLSFDLNPVAFELFGYAIYWYGIIIALGFLLGTSFCLHVGERFGITKDNFLDILLIATPLAIVGARLYYVIFYLDLFRNPDGSLDFLKMLRIHDGGLAIYGGILMAVLVSYLVTKRKHISFFAFMDVLSFGLLIGQMVGRYGNFVNSEAYGSETTLPWRMSVEELRDGVLTTIEVHPTFLYESLWNFLSFILLFVLLLRLKKRPYDGLFFTLYVLLYGVGRGFIEGLRTDSLYLFDTGIRVSQLLGFGSAVLALVFLLSMLRKGQQPLYVDNKEKQNKKT